MILFPKCPLLRGDVFLMFSLNKNYWVILQRHNDFTELTNDEENNIKAQLTGFPFSTSESLLIEQSNHWTMGVLPEQNVSQGTWTRIVFTGSFACIWSELRLVVNGNHSRGG